MTAVDKLREVMEALEPFVAVDWALKEIPCNPIHHNGGIACTHCLLEFDKEERLRAKATLAKVIEEMEKPPPTPWKSSPPYNVEY